MLGVRNKRVSLVVVLALWSTLLCAADLPPLTHGFTPLDGDQSAPPLSLPDMDDETLNLEALRGKVVVVNFWATWCPPCRREMPSLERLNQMTDDEEVVIVAVNVGEDVDTVFPFLGTIDPSPSFPIVFDRDASLTSWKVRGLPTTFVVDPAGKLAYRAVGGREFDHPDVVKQLQGLIRP